MHRSRQWRWPLAFVSLMLLGFLTAGMDFYVPIPGASGGVLVIVGSGMLTAHVQTPGGFNWPKGSPTSGRCPACGYDLRGPTPDLPSPECGTRHDKK